METQQVFESWAILELFGHQVIAGRVTEQTIGGCPFIRVDVPECDGQPAFTRFFGNGAIYSMTPVSEELALHAIKRSTPRPVSAYGLIPATTARQEELFDPDEYDDQDRYERDEEGF